MTDHRSIEKAAASSEAAEAVGRRDPRGTRGGEVEAAMMRYLAAEQYHEKVEESREEAADEPEAPR